MSPYLAACEARDPKGLYTKARTGEIPEFTSISVPYELPEQAELRIDIGTIDVDGCLDQALRYVEQYFLLKL